MGVCVGFKEKVKEITKSKIISLPPINTIGGKSVAKK
jgi:hypothetical protein